MRITALIALTLSATALSGCIAKTAVDVVTAPVRVASSAVDLATTSQSEKDEKRGREIRKQEEKLGKLERQYDKQLEECRDGSRIACDKASDIYAEMQIIMRSLPAEPNPE